MRVRLTTSSGGSASEWDDWPTSSTHAADSFALLQRAAQLVALIDDIGTGGRVDVADLQSHRTTGGAFLAISPSKILATNALYSPGQAISLIRAELSFNISELADVLAVSRPTIYGWMDDVQPRSRHRQRIQLLVRLARHWNHLSQDPLGPMRESLIERLRQPAIDESSLLHHLSDLADAISSMEPRHEGFVQRALKKRGMKVRSQGDEAIHRVTGTRSAAD